MDSYWLHHLTLSPYCHSHYPILRAGQRDVCPCGWHGPKLHTCTTCKCEVVDGRNGTVGGIPPWLPRNTPPQVSCYRCENEAEAESDRLHMASSVEAAARAGRFDCI